MAEHQGAVEPHAEGEAAILLRVDAARHQDPWVDHAAATPLDPALALTGSAGGHGLGVAVADVAAYVDLGARLREREVRRPEPGRRVGVEDRPGEMVEGALEMGHRQAPVDR